ncbi:MAG: hypothetical protein A2X48_07055 [Lentisphaerae bacterium GWF2_49_21]|nr:MAG: hypothetical protein A2X48_07055 [Lentisphaerae bacterium GWF2_49_21]
MNSNMEIKRRSRIDELSGKYRKMDSEGDDLDLKLKDLDTDKISARFFSSHGKMVLKAAIVAKNFPEEAIALKSTGEDILDHRFNLLGYGPACFGFPIRWHCDYRSSKEWPGDVNYLALGHKMFDVIVDKKAGLEVKVPWDLSNMMWLPTLACSYHLTGDRKYAEAFKNDMSDWIVKNPYPLGVNWICPMNISIRAMNMIVAMTSLYPALEKDFQMEAIESLFQHGIAIMAYPELGNNDKRNNHYLTDLTGLYFLGQFFKDTEEGAEWLDFSTKELEQESGYQFYPDGVNFEDSTSYHRLSSEMLLLCAILARDNGAGFSKGFLDRLHRSLTFSSDILQTNGRIPMFGDNDNGRMLQFHGFSRTASADHRHILAAGGEFFNDDSLRFPGRNAATEAVWLLGSFKSPSIPAGKTGPLLKKYPDSGYYIIDDGERKIVIRNARINPSCGGGHTHCDQFSFTLSSGKQEILVDPGTYLYSSNFEERNLFRSVEYHNTVQIGSEPMHEYDRDTFGGLWWMKDLADAETARFERKSESTFFDGKIHSYEKSRGYTIRRKLKYVDGILSLADSAIPITRNKPGKCPAFSRFLLAPGLMPSVGKSGVVSIRKGSKKICSIEILSESFSVRIKDLWVAPGYGTKVPSKQIEIEWTVERGLEVNIKILTYLTSNRI